MPFFAHLYMVKPIVLSARLRSETDRFTKTNEAFACRNGPFMTISWAHENHETIIVHRFSHKNCQLKYLPFMNKYLIYLHILHDGLFHTHFLPAFQCSTCFLKASLQGLYRIWLPQTGTPRQNGVSSRYGNPMKSAIGENPKGPKGPKGPQQTLILQKPEWALDLAGLDHPDSLE